QREREDQVEEQLDGRDPEREARVGFVAAGPRPLPARRGAAGGHGRAAAVAAMSWRYQPPRIASRDTARYAASRAAARSGPVPTALSTRPLPETRVPPPSCAVFACST